MEIVSIPSRIALSEMLPGGVFTYGRCSDLYMKTKNIKPTLSDNDDFVVVNLRTGEIIYLGHDIEVISVSGAFVENYKE